MGIDDFNIIIYQRCSHKLHAHLGSDELIKELSHLIKEISVISPRVRCYSHFVISHWTTNKSYLYEV